jgi:hypothetical protein
MSEGGATGLDNTNPYNVLKRDWVAAGKAAALRGDPAPGGRVEVVPTSVSGGFPTLVTNLQGDFQTKYGCDVKKMPMQVRQLWAQSAHHLGEDGNSRRCLRTSPASGALGESCK